MFQRTHYIQNAVEIPVCAHILTNDLVAFFFVAITFGIFGLVYPTRNQYRRVRFIHTKDLSNNTTNILNDFHIRRFRVDENTHIRVFRINAFSDCLARRNYHYFIVGSLIERRQYRFFVFRFSFESNHRNLFIGFVFGEFGFLYLFEYAFEFRRIHKIQHGFIAFRIHVGMKSEDAIISAG